MSTAFRRMWGTPILLGILTAVGLLSALLGDGVWDYVSAVTLGIPVLTAGWYSFKR
jgi:hypothetical protein